MDPTEREQRWCDALMDAIARYEAETGQQDAPAVALPEDLAQLIAPGLDAWDGVDGYQAHIRSRTGEEQTGNVDCEEDDHG
jgi:hypothetical protein